MTEKHPLLETTLHTIGNWEDWLKLWNETPYLELRHSLLHFGFDVPCEDPVSRILFYLSIADGWNEHPFDKEGRDHGLLHRPTPRMKKGDLSRKAFEVLCLRRFKKTKEYNEERYNFGWMCEEQTLVAVLAFFYGIDPYHYDREEKRLKNLERGDSDKHSAFARDFLIDFIDWAWAYSEYDKKELVAMLTSHRPDFLELLYGMRRLALFTGYGMALDEASIAKLEELALGQKLYFQLERTHRRPVTIEEAVYAGSPAAQLLTLYRVSREERERLEEIQRLESEQRDAERRLAQLKSI